MEARSTPAVSAPRMAIQVSAKVLLAPTAALSLDALSPICRGWPAARLAHPPPLAVPILLGKQSFLI
jgi:hypothetical protein